MINNQEQRNKGYTLVETLVSIVIFSFLSVGVVNVFVSAMKTQTRILYNQELMEQSSYSLEYMGKLLRMVKKDVTGDCTGTANENYGVASDQITFLVYDTKEGEYMCRRFSLADGVISESKSTDETAENLATASEITSSKVNVTELIFNVIGDSEDDAQPKTTILIRMEPTSQSLSENLGIVVQTSISQRQLDIN
jgi:prepilin-type N-terminal cleavage/methylation domain-containing protein